jgi:membrane-associated phospholipid phosphatase
MAIVSKYKSYFSNRTFVWSFIFSFILLAISLVINFYAGTYATEVASNSVSDIILNNIRVFDVDGIFIYGPIIFWFITGPMLIVRPWRIPFTLKSISLFVFIRSIFITLTHLGLPIDHIAIPASNILDKISFGDDLFFSGHTGLPFLLALIFWDHRVWRIFFLFASVFFAAVVLMGHLHYSIDVLGAYFITYTIFHMCQGFFKKDHQVFNHGLEGNL